MIENLKKRFIEMVNETEWMDIQSRYAAIDKINVIHQRIAFPDGLDNNRTILESIYKDGFHFIRILIFHLSIIILIYLLFKIFF